MSEKKRGAAKPGETIPAEQPVGKAAPKRKRPQVDWASVERDYRAGIKTLRQMAEEHGISHVAIAKRAKVDGWLRGSQSEKRSTGGVSISSLDDLDCAGYVYGLFIDVGLRRLYKVGLARSPDVRAAAHQTSLPFEAKLAIAYFVPNMRLEERTLHQMFAEKLVRGEWFDLDDADLDRMAMRSRLA